MPDTTERWQSDGKNMLAQFQTLGYEIDMQNANLKVADQVSQIDAMIAKGDDALVIGAIDGPALKDVLAKAASKQIPVIAYDRLILGSPDVDYYATFDNAKVGLLQGKALVAALGLTSAKRPFTIELFAGSPTDNNAGFFFDGAMAVLKPYIASGQLVVKSGQTTFKEAATADWDGKKAGVRMDALLSSDYSNTTLDAVLSPNDGVARGVLAALAKHGYGKGALKYPVITGQDSELDSVKLVASGVQTETIFKDTRELAKVAVQMTNSLLTGQKPPVNDTKQYNNGVKVVPTFLLQPVSVVKDNVQAVLVDSGYIKASDLS